jgi:hypothetical protein
MYGDSLLNIQTIAEQFLRREYGKTHLCAHLNCCAASIGGQRRGHKRHGCRLMAAMKAGGGRMSMIMGSVAAAATVRIMGSVAAAATMRIVAVMVVAGAVAAVAFLGATVAGLTGRPGGPGAPQAVRGTGTVITGEDLKGGAVAVQRVRVGQKKLVE